MDRNEVDGVAILEGAGMGGGKWEIRVERMGHEILYSL